METYIEPFGGSYSVGFHLPYNIPIEIYNDLESNVYSLFKVLSDEELFHDFQKKVELAPYSEELRKEFKGKLKTEKDLSLVKRAFYFFYVNRTSVNGVGGFSVSNIVRRNMSKSTSDYLSSVDRLQEVHERLSKVIVTNQDGIALIKRYDKTKTFIYCDPPYVQSTRNNTRYDVEMDDKKQMEFLNALLEVENAKVLVSGYDNGLYNVLTESGKFEKVQFLDKLNDGKNEAKSKMETLWKNY